jgi:DNA invertase Pin-like site-specific DNA recombinase
MDRSGGDDQRPVLRAAIERIERGELDGLVVWNFKRFARSIKSSIHFTEIIEGVGGQLVSISESIDPTTPQGRTMRTLFFAMAQEELDIQSEGFEQSKGDAIRKGIWTAPFVPFGYLKTADRILVPDPDVAPLVRRAFIMRGAGASWTAIAAMISEGLGRPFYGPTVSRMIKSRTYLGEARQGKHFNPTAHEPLVDQETWDAAQRPMPRPPRGAHPPALLGGIIRCAGCSRRMSSTFIKGARQYRCRVHGAGGECPEPASINAPLIEPLVTEAVLAELENLTATASERSSRIDDAERALAEAEAELAAYTEAVAAMNNRAAFAKGATERDDAVSAARVELAEARSVAPKVPTPELLRELWPGMSEAERNQVLRASLDVVWVKRGRGQGRVRLIAAGLGPTDLSIQGKAFRPVRADWPVDDLPGEVGVTSAEHGEETVDRAAA